MKKKYNKPEMIIVEHKGSVVMLNTSGSGKGGVVTPPRGKDFEIENTTPSSPNLWEEEE